MSALGDAFEAAVRAHVGEAQPGAMPDRQPEWRDVFEAFDSNSDIATAAGYGRPGQHARGTAAWRRRRTFMRNLQRYRQEAEGGGGQRRTPRKLDTRLRSIVRTRWRREATPRTVRDVLRLMGELGTTTTYVVVKFRYSSRKNPLRERAREIEVSVYTDPEVYAEVGWPADVGDQPLNDAGWHWFGTRYLRAYAIAYGLPGELVEAGVEDPQFIFTIGREGEITYDYRAS